MNIADILIEQANRNPNKIAIKAPIKQLKDNSYIYESLTFSELIAKAQSIANGLLEMGLKKGDKTLVFVRPGLDFPAITFALFATGIVPVFIDPGMGRKNLLKCIEQVKPVGLIAVPEVHILRLVFRKKFKSVKHFVTTGKLRWSSMKTLRALTTYPAKNFETPKNDDDLAAILFTSGGTGSPKGVEYTHKIFTTQTKMLQKMFSLTESDIDIPGFPLFALFTMAMGMTSCIPDMNPSKPASADPKKLIHNINDNRATFVAGSPAIWERVGKYCEQNKLTLPSVKYLVMFGAPVSLKIHEQFSKILTNGTTYTPYGATESLPVACISGKEILEKYAQRNKEGKGTCLGPAVAGCEIKIIKITDAPIESVDQMHELPINEIGEIIVKGDTVTKSYFDLADKTKEAKIYDTDSLWHRIGDIGYLDEDNNLWFCGRKTHRVETQKELISSIQAEAIFNNHEKVKRSALVGIGPFGAQKPGIVIELNDSKVDKNQLKQELKSLGKKYSHTQDIEDFWFHPSFPVDVRHNIKIDRVKLSQMVSQGELK
ncbi:fatty acid CoA ligase family protein [Halobacteriovorax sp. HLS]|uniref:fatty acid CoA ligase family protein n=1 Tax=Halobacteriovorax sp. HLS TaxID=2234000 RepID=UPI000FD96251|nr:fatty acid CoA ligase family protein [Halobacteriovorax sp. HLS]